VLNRRHRELCGSTRALISTPSARSSSMLSCHDRGSAGRSWKRRFLTRCSAVSVRWARGLLCPIELHGGEFLEPLGLNIFAFAEEPIGFALGIARQSRPMFFAKGDVAHRDLTAGEVAGLSDRSNVEDLPANSFSRRRGVETQRPLNLLASIARPRSKCASAWATC
jgi:hypothetical protein